MKNRVVAFTPADANHDDYFHKLQNSLRKFHSEEELPLIRTTTTGDPMYFYKATPLEGKRWLTEYDVVIKLDADQIITGNLSHLWAEDDYDLGVVNNSNPREFANYPYQFLGMDPMMYFNCGMVVMRSQKLVDHWLNLCSSDIFNACQMKEQDLMNILCRMDFKIKLLDTFENKWHGLISKGYWPQVELRDDKLILPKNEEWPTDADKEIVCLHWAGGNDPNKGNYAIRFQPEVAKRLDWLTKNETTES